MSTSDDLPGTHCQAEGKPGVNESFKLKERLPDSRGKFCEKVNSNSALHSAKKRVLKQVGSTSASFIGPACRPKKGNAKPQLNIEQSLTEFYRELENIDSTDAVSCVLVKNARSKSMKSGPTDQLYTNTEDSHSGLHSDTDANLNHFGQKRQFSPQYHQDDPYFDPKRHRSGHDHWQPLPTRPPCPRFLRAHNMRPPPRYPGGFQGPAPHFMPQTNHDWNYRFQPPSLSRDFVGHSPHQWVGNHWGGNYDDWFNPRANWSGIEHDYWSVGENLDLHHRPALQPKSAEQQDCKQEPDVTLSLILMRGLPGSGKSTTAQELLSTGSNGLILSTDDYFAHQDGYLYDPKLLSDAHQWNQSRAEDAMQNSRSPVIIDNTNLQAWEMKPYVKMALDRGYRVSFHEPDTSWKFDPAELEKRTKHGVPQQKIAQMLDRFCFSVSVDVVMCSQEPPHAKPGPRPQPQPQPLP